MNNKILELTEQARSYANNVYCSMETEPDGEFDEWFKDIVMKKFAELIAQECIDKIETYRIPYGNSPAGEMVCEWTYDALKSIRDDIKETFGLESE